MFPRTRLLLLGVLLLVACSQELPVEGTPPPNDSAQSSLSTGWEYFEAGDYAEAEFHFERAHALAPGWSSAWAGLGWNQLRLSGDAPSLEAALADFDHAIDLDAFNSDALAGRACAELALSRDPAQIRSSLTTLLNRSPEYGFAHDATVNRRSLLWVRARLELWAGDAEAAWMTLHSLAHVALVPELPQSWVVAGQIYPSFEAALAALLEQLERLLMG